MNKKILKKIFVIFIISLMSIQFETGYSYGREVIFYKETTDEETADEDTPVVVNTTVMKEYTKNTDELEYFEYMKAWYDEDEYDEDEYEEWFNEHAKEEYDNWFNEQYKDGEEYNTSEITVIPDVYPVYPSEVLSDLQTNFGYEGSVLMTKMKLVTKVTILDGGNGKYWLRIGKDPSNNESNTLKYSGGLTGRGYTYDELKNMWGYSGVEEDIVKGSTSWVVVCIVSYDSVIWSTVSTSNEDGQPNRTFCWKATITLNDIYAGTYEEKGENSYQWAVDATDAQLGIDDAVPVADGDTEIDYDDLYNYGSSSSSTVLTWARKFLKNPIGMITNVILDVFKEIADAIQMLINLMQTVPLGVYNDWTVKYTYTRLENDGEEGKRNQYTQVEDYEDKDGIRDAYNNGDNGYKLSKYIDDSKSTNGNKYYFEETKIPIMYVDFYTMALNQVNVLDVNFLTGNETHEDGSVWMIIRNFVAGFILVSYYVAALILLLSLIWMAVKIVMNSMNPYQKAKDKEGLDKIIVGVIMLVGTLVIMALSIFSYQAVLGEIYTEGDYEQPIRVYLYQDWNGWFGLAGNYHENYSFSTNFTGYIRFMAEIENPNRCMEKAGYVIAYVVLVLMNVIVLGIMIIRTAAMWILSIIGPILAAMYAVTSNKKVMDWYKMWVYLYIVFALIQVFFAIVCAALLNFMEF